jgi:hypothetical protein
MKKRDIRKCAKFLNEMSLAFYEDREINLCVEMELILLDVRYSLLNILAK